MIQELWYKESRLWESTVLKCVCVCECVSRELSQILLCRRIIISKYSAAGLAFASSVPFWPRVWFLNLTIIVKLCVQLVFEVC